MAMIVTVTVPRERPSFVAKVADAYLDAAVFALDSWGEHAHRVEQLRADVREHGPSAAYGQAVMMREHWRDQSERCERIAVMLGEMRP